MECERCKWLTETLNRERKELHDTKERLAAADARARGRKQLLNQIQTQQLGSAEAARRAISAVISHILFTTKPNSEMHAYVVSHSQKLHNVAQQSLDAFSDTANKNAIRKKWSSRKKDEHSMPRRGGRS